MDVADAPDQLWSFCKSKGSLPIANLTYSFNFNYQTLYLNCLAAPSKLYTSQPVALAFGTTVSACLVIHKG